MANSTSNIDPIVNGQGAQHVTANSFFDAASQAALYGRRASTSAGLTWGYYGGNASLVGGSVAVISNGTLTLTASTTNYIVALKSSGAVSFSTATTNWNNTTDYWRLYSVVTGTTTVTSYTDYREFGRITGADTLADSLLDDAATLILNTQTDSYTLVLSDTAKYVRMNKATANNLTVPLNSSVAFVTGTQIHIRQVGAGQTTIVATGGVTITTPETLKLRKQHATATLVKVGTDSWELMGDLEAAP